MLMPVPGKYWYPTQGLENIWLITRVSLPSNEIISTPDVLGWDKHRHSDCDRRETGLGVFLIVEAGAENSLLECSIGAGYTRVPALLSGWPKAFHLTYHT